MGEGFCRGKKGFLSGVGPVCRVQNIVDEKLPIFTNNSPSGRVPWSISVIADFTQSLNLERGRNRLLIFADECATRHALVDIVRRTSYAVDVTASASDALSRTVSYAPSVVLADVRLQGNSTINLIDAIVQYLPHISVIIVTLERALCMSRPTRLGSILSSSCKRSSQIGFR